MSAYGRVSGLIGVLFHFFGYFVIWLGASGNVDLPYWMYIVSGLIASNSLLWLDTTAIVTCMRNFPNERGSIAGALLISWEVQMTRHGLNFTEDICNTPELM